jgi:hypothetical protein
LSRVINTNSPGKIRHYHLRTTAEIMKRLAAKSTIDDQSKDMVSVLVFSLREIYSSVETSATAWEKRGYWMKADRFLREWEWSQELSVNIEDVIRNEAWDLLPELLVDLVPYTSDIEVKIYTRSPKTWQGAYQRLTSQTPSELP